MHTGPQRRGPVSYASPIHLRYPLVCTTHALAPPTRLHHVYTCATHTSASCMPLPIRSSAPRMHLRHPLVCATHAPALPIRSCCVLACDIYSSAPRIRPRRPATLSLTRTATIHAATHAAADTAAILSRCRCAAWSFRHLLLPAPSAYTVVVTGSPASTAELGVDGRTGRLRRDALGHIGARLFTCAHAAARSRSRPLTLLSVPLLALSAALPLTFHLRGKLTERFGIATA